MRQNFQVIGVLVAAMWLLFLLNWLSPIDLNQWGLRPRSMAGLVGVPLMPFLHANWGHLIGNTIPLLILLLLLVGSRGNPWAVVAFLVVAGGMLLWLVGRPAVHIGASNLVFGLSSFLIVVGFREQRPIAIAVAAAVAILYGGTMLSGIIPRWGSSTSWDGHLCGLIAGVAAGTLFSERPRK